MRGWHSLTEKNRYFDKVEIKILNLILLLRQQKGFRRIFMDTKEKLWSWREKFGSQHFKLSCSESIWKVNIAICDWRQTQAGGKNSWECESVLHFLSLLSHCPFIHFISFLSLSLRRPLLPFLSLYFSIFYQFLFIFIHLLLSSLSLSSSFSPSISTSNERGWNRWPWWWSSGQHPCLQLLVYPSVCPFVILDLSHLSLPYSFSLTQT